MKRRRRRAAAPKRRRRNPELVTIGLAGNPSRAPSAAAIAAFRRFHQADPSGLRELGPGMPDLIALGDLKAIVYRPTRSARSGPAFEHQFGRGAILAATVDGKRLFCLPAKGKPFHVDWNRGIIG